MIVRPLNSTYNRKMEQHQSRQVLKKIFEPRSVGRGNPTLPSMSIQSNVDLEAQALFSLESFEIPAEILPVGVFR